MQEYSGTFGEKLGKFLKTNVDTLAIVLISIIYIFAGTLKLVPTGESIRSIIAASILNLIVGITIKALCRSQGLRDGQKDEQYNKTLALYGEKLDRNTDKITKLDMYCDYHNDLKLKRKQIKFLRKYGLSYDKFINGEYDEDKKYKKIVYKCRRLRYFTLNSSMLLNTVNIIDIEDKISKTTPSQYQAKGIGMNIPISLLCAILFGYYTASGGFEIVRMVWATLQIAVNLVLGALAYILASNFIKNDLRTRIKYMINCFDEFESLDAKHFFDNKEEKLLKNEDITDIFDYTEGE